MATTYTLDPPPTAKVILRTTAGDLTLELFAKQTPLACRNFLQHCLDGYYTDTVFHRLVPNFIVQGGDPTGTGQGGESAIHHGKGFADEIHSRLKFGRRGLLGMAKGDDGGYGSQFFFTLGPTPELVGQCTMFGRVEGETVYNLVRMGEGELVEGTERPAFPVRVTGAQILVNPFEELVPRVRSAVISSATEDRRSNAKKRKRVAGKNALSFAVEDQEGEETVGVIKRTKANPKLLAVDVEKEAVEKTTTKQKNILAERSVTAPLQAKPPDPPFRPTSLAQPSPHHESSDQSADEYEHQQPSGLDRTNAEIAALTASLRQPDVQGLVSKKKEKPQNVLEAMIPAGSTRGRKRGKATDEQGAYDTFRSFQSRLARLPSALRGGDGGESPAANSHAVTNVAKENEDGDEEAALCDLHFIANCDSCRSWDADGEADAGDSDEGGDRWMTHQLSFARATRGKRVEWTKRMREIEVIDPREKAKELQQDRRQDRAKAKT